MKTRYFKFLLLALPILFAGCSNTEAEADAYGSFETDEVTVSARSAGTLETFQIEEGDHLEKGQVIAIVDTTQLYLKQLQLEAQAAVIRSKMPGIISQLNVLKEQEQNVRHELSRFSALAEKGAATAKQVDDLKDQIAVLQKQMAQIEAQNLPLTSELKVLEIQAMQIRKQLDDAVITAPFAGGVILKLANESEWVHLGMPLFRMAEMDQLILRVYVSGKQLDDIRLGQKVEVMTDDDADKNHHYPGTITWISEEAEFTPKAILTKEERVDLVYAVKIKVPNDGSLKVGMPGMVRFTKPEAEG